MPIALQIRAVKYAPGLKPDELAKYADILTSNSAKRIAEGARKRLQYWLSKGGPYNIGASGRASENFQVLAGTMQAGGKYVTGRISWDVVEGESTPANALIRRGIPAVGFENRSSIPIRDLKRWIAEKGISVVPPDVYSGRKAGQPGDTGGAVLVRPGGRIKNPYARSLPFRKRKTEEALYAIRTVLAKYGTFRIGSNWWTMSPYPKRQGRFDYPAYLLKFSEVFWSEARQASRDIAGFIVDYITSGRKTGFGVREF